MDNTEHLKAIDETNNQLEEIVDQLSQIRAAIDGLNQTLKQKTFYK